MLILLLILGFSAPSGAEKPVDVSTPTAYYEEKNSVYNVQLSSNTADDKLDALIRLLKMRGQLQ